MEQNDIDLSELTLGDLIGTENVADITDIGGIAGQSGGVIRACMNRGTVGYQHMGYNVGGSASQTGSHQGLASYGAAYARKEGGGIVGQMGPAARWSTPRIRCRNSARGWVPCKRWSTAPADDASAASSDLSNQLHALKKQRVQLPQRHRESAASRPRMAFPSAARPSRRI